MKNFNEMTDLDLAELLADLFWDYNNVLDEARKGFHDCTLWGEPVWGIESPSYDDRLEDVENRIRAVQAELKVRRSGK